MNNFWKKFKKPILALAPMDDVTDTVFRRVIAKHQSPDVFFTEFIPADGLCSRGIEGLRKKLYFTEEESPLVIQLFGANPDNFYEAAKIVASLGFNGIDINMGCPDKDVVKIGAGSGLIKTPELARKIIAETKRGAPDLPVSVKTRIGFENILKPEEWIGEIIKEEPVALTIHGRTKKELSLVPAHWDEISKLSQFIKEKNQEIIVLGNGDIQSLNEAQEKITNYKVDGVMIGRGIFGKPWFFLENKNLSFEEKMNSMVQHSFLFEEFYAGRNFDVMKKHLKAYASDFSGAKDLRIKLMGAKNASEVAKIIDEFMVVI